MLSQDQREERGGRAVPGAALPGGLPGQGVSGVYCGAHVREHYAEVGVHTHTYTYTHIRTHTHTRTQTMTIAIDLFIYGLPLPRFCSLCILYASFSLFNYPYSVP